MDANLEEYLRSEAEKDFLLKQQLKGLVSNASDAATSEYINPRQTVTDIDIAMAIQDLSKQAQANKMNSVQAGTGLAQVLSNIQSQGQQQVASELEKKQQYANALKDALSTLQTTDFVGTTQREVGRQLTDDYLQNKARLAKEAAEAQKSRSKKNMLYNILTGGLAGAGQALTIAASKDKK